MRERGQVVDSVSCLDDDAAAVPAVPAVRSPFGNVLQTSKAQATIAAFASSQIDLYAVNKHVV